MGLSPRILNGIEIERHSMPFLADISGYCTGVIIGKRHVLTAAHCIDGKVQRKHEDGKIKYFLDNGKEWNITKFIWVGTHEKKFIDESKDPHGQKLEKKTAWSLLRNKTAIEFPIYPDKITLNPEIPGLDCSKQPCTDLTNDHVMDFAVIELTNDIKFFAGQVEKANFDSNLPYCKKCTLDCNQNNRFVAVGWGKYARGNL